MDGDKSWMTLGNRLGKRYREGAEFFVNSAMAKASIHGNIKCPCNKCMNRYWNTKDEVEKHLVRHGIMETYTNWVYHGESVQEHQTHISDGNINNRVTDNEDEDDVEIPELVEDYYRGTYMDRDWGGSEFDEETNSTQKEEVKNIEKLLEAAQREVYPGCKKYTLLKFVITMLHLKVMGKWSNKSFDMMMGVLLDLLPEGNLVPRSTYEAKKFLRELGLGYEAIHACQHDCALFWKENAELQNCPVCGESRYKLNDGNGKKIPHKVLRYFPLTPRLRRLYMSRKIATDMRWHRDKRVDDGLLRHPADSEEWKDFDRNYPEFSCEPRNVRLRLATDGFNPFGNMSNSYSMWPVILMSYNLPPWKCMKDPFFMMSLLIPGPHAPGKEIDVYMRPLVDELNELWTNGVLTYDAASEQTFRMHAAVMWTINDFPAYGNLSGWSTKGYLACPICNEDALSQRLRSKIGYTGHRCYLPENHPWRRSKAFNGKFEHRTQSLKLPLEKINDQLDRLPDVKFGKHPSNKTRPRDQKNLNWTKKSILYELPYWKKLKLRYNLDVMHIVKNICDNLLGTILNLDGKNKDTEKARLDLEDMGIRTELHLQRRHDGSFVKPQAIYTLTSKEREGFCDFLKSVKYPDGYAANISRCVTTKAGKLSGLKSHDCHILLQRLLAIGLRGYLTKDISTTLSELGEWFQELCSRTLVRSDVEKLEERIILILCKMEKIFPPAFFDVMVHLAVHLAHEAKLAGPVQYRWMFPIER